MRIRDIVASLDRILLSAMLLLILTGLAMLVSATYSQGGLSSLFIRQGISLIAGFSLFVLALKIPYHVWRDYAPVLYGLGIVALVFVALTGTLVRGTISRLEFFGFQLQPSEFAKIALVILLARILAKYQHFRWRAVFITALLVAIPVALVLSEPDVGVAALMILTWAGLMLTVGVPWRILGILGLIGILLIGGAWQWVLLDYQKARIQTFLNPAADPLRSGYNITQAIIALGSGQVLGRGLGHGPQSQLKFLPERHTDFILASIGEELGFVGILVVIALYSVLLWRLLVIAQSTRDSFGRLLCIGTFLLLFISFGVSTGMNMGLLPVTGIPLPLVSYGGSNLITTLLLLGLVQSVKVYSKFTQAPAPEISGFI